MAQYHRPPPVRSMLLLYCCYSCLAALLLLAGTSGMNHITFVEGTQRRIQVRVERCNNVPDRDTGGLFGGSSESDPKIRVCLSGSPTGCKTTPKRDNNRNPTWGSTYDFYVTNPMSRSFSFTLLDDDSGLFPPSSDDTIGSWNWPVSTIGFTGKNEMVEKVRNQGWRCYIRFTPKDFLTAEPTLSEVVSDTPRQPTYSVNKTNSSSHTVSTLPSVSITTKDDGEGSTLSQGTGTLPSHSIATSSVTRTQDLTATSTGSSYDRISGSPTAMIHPTESYLKHSTPTDDADASPSLQQKTETEKGFLKSVTHAPQSASRSRSPSYSWLSPTHPGEDEVQSSSSSSSKSSSNIGAHGESGASSADDVIDPCTREEINTGLKKNPGSTTTSPLLDSLAFFSAVSDPSSTFLPLDEPTQISTGRRGLRAASWRGTRTFVKSRPILNLAVGFSSAAVETLKWLRSRERDIPLLLRLSSRSTNNLNPALEPATTNSFFSIASSRGKQENNSNTIQSASIATLDVWNSSSSWSVWNSDEDSFWDQHLEVIVNTSAAFRCAEKLFPADRFEIGPNFTLSLHEKPELPLAAEMGLVARPAIAFAAASSLMGSASNSLYQTRVSTLTALASCEFEHDTSLGAFISPTDLRFGPQYGQYYRGAIIGNLLVFLAFNLFFALLALVITFITRYRREKVSQKTTSGAQASSGSSPTFTADYRESLTAIHFPSVLVVPTALGLQGTVSSSVSIFVHSQSFGDILLAFFGLCACLIICIGCTVPTMKKYFPLELRIRTEAKEGSLRSRTRRHKENHQDSAPHGSAPLIEVVTKDVDEEQQGESPSNSTTDDSNNCLKKRMDQCFDYLMLSDYHWVDPRGPEEEEQSSSENSSSKKKKKKDSSNKSKWKRRYLFLFYDYKFQWFLPMEIWVSFLLGIVEGIRMSEKRVCVAQATIAFLAFLVVALLAAGLYPSFTRFQQGFILIIYTLSAIGGICLVYTLLYEDDSLSGSAASGVEAAALGVAGIGMLKFIVDIWFAILWLKSMKNAKSVVVTQFQKTFLPNVGSLVEDSDLNKAAQKETTNHQEEERNTLLGDPLLQCSSNLDDCVPSLLLGGSLLMLQEEETSEDLHNKNCERNETTGREPRFDSYEPPSLNTSGIDEGRQYSEVRQQSKTAKPRKISDGSDLWGHYEYIDEDLDEKSSPAGSREPEEEEEGKGSSSLLLLGENSAAQHQDPFYHPRRKGIKQQDHLGLRTQLRQKLGPGWAQTQQLSHKNSTAASMYPDGATIEDAATSQDPRQASITLRPKEEKTTPSSSSPSLEDLL